MTVPLGDQSFEVEADGLAMSIGVDPASRVVQSTRGWTSHATWYNEASQLTGVVSPHVGREADEALAHGLALRSGDDEHSKRLVLVLPAAHVHATLRRRRWLTADVEVRAHFGGAVIEPHLANPPLPDVQDRQVLHLGESSAQISDLVDWLATNPDLDPAHRANKRAWQCRGQLLLVVTQAGKGLSIVAGSQATADGALLRSLLLKQGQALSEAELEQIIDVVNSAIDAKLANGRRDEHWLQSEIRRRPGLLRLESPVLREVPAWRPIGDGVTDDAWGRGFIDLMALDAQGYMEIIETKVAADPMLVLQGVDYLDWAERPEQKKRISDRLGSSVDVPYVLHFVIGEGSDGKTEAGRYALAAADSLRSDVRFRFSLLRNWRNGGEPEVEMLEFGQLPRR